MNLPLSLLTACGPDVDDGAILLVPEDLQVTWSEALEHDDGVGSVFWLDAEVLDAEGRPAAGVLVEVTSGWSGARAALPSALESVDDDVACADDCELWSDGQANTWIIHPTRRWNWEDALPGGYLSGTTDADGRFPFVVLLDSAPDIGARTPVFLSIAVETGSFEIAVLDPMVASN